MPMGLMWAIFEEAKTWARGLPPDCSPPRRPAFEAAVAISLFGLCCPFSL
jgi:hypothetical protein